MAISGGYILLQGWEIQMSKRRLMNKCSECLTEWKDLVAISQKIPNLTCYKMFITVFLSQTTLLSIWVIINIRSENILKVYPGGSWSHTLAQQQISLLRGFVVPRTIQVYSLKRETTLWIIILASITLKLQRLIY